jgi:hypothetical protein
VSRPPLSSLPDPDQCLRQHLANEVHWLLRAANEWLVQDQMNLEIDGYHVQVYAMDSAFLHARTLFEFLTQKTGPNNYGVDQFKISPLQSDLYATGWKPALHAYVMHAQPRDSPQQLQALDGSLKDLNAMPRDFAREIERLWIAFADQLRDSGNTVTADCVEAVLTEARAQAEAVLNNEMATRRALS